MTERSSRVAILLLAATFPLLLHASVAESRKHVEYLAAEELEGRLAGTSGEERGARYIAEQLQALGARPLPDREGFLQTFEFTAGTSDAGSSLVLEIGDDEAVIMGTEQVQALSFSDNGRVSGPVVFAGYGLTVPEGQEFDYDSYFGLDVQDKIVLVLRYVPEDVEQDARSMLARYSGLRYKALRAREAGAKAVLLVTGPRSPNAGETIPMSFDTALSGSGILAASIGGDVAQRIFARVPDRTLANVQESLDSGNPHVTGFDIPGLTLTLDVKVERETREGHNVLGYLPATSETPADDRLLILGAHLDHLGRGDNANSLADKDEAGGVHHGADDNASGVAAVLSAGARLVDKERARPVVLAFWSGEELGLLGSTEFINSDLLPAEQILAYLNFDMVGRMEEEKLTLQAVGSSTVWPGLIERTNVVVGLDLNLQDDPYLPTDATAFYQADVPTLNFFTGSHEDYHRPSDLPDKLNYEGIEQISHFAALLTQKLAAEPDPPEWVKVEPKREQGGDRDTVRAFTGTIPDYTTEVDGLRLSGVIGGGPADEAGLREGDVIVEFAGQRIANIYDYTYALDAVKVDVPVEVVFVRDGERVEVTIVPTSRK